MRVLAKFVLAFSLIIVLNAQAKAGPLFSFLTNPGFNTLNDASVSLAFGPNGKPLPLNSTVAAGDVVAGVLRIQNSTTNGNGTNFATQQLAIVFSAQISAVHTATSTNGAGQTIQTNTYDFVPTTVSGLTIQDLVGGKQTNYNETFSPNTVFAVFENSNTTSPTLVTFPSATSAIKSSYTFDTSGGIVNTAANGDYFQAQLSANTTLGQNFTPGSLSSRGSVTPLGQDSGAFTKILDNTGVPGLGSVPVTITDFNGNTHASAFTFEAQLFGPTPQQKANGYYFSDHTAVAFNAAVPEPATCVLFVLGSVGLGYIGRRQKKQQVCA